MWALALQAAGFDYVEVARLTLGGGGGADRAGVHRPALGCRAVIQVLLPAIRLASITITLPKACGCATAPGFKECENAPG
ncbi:hypothetical protein EI28_00785 [Methanoculleus sp. MH98A]|nr:hypothetical protein EI28_00785 [Methanoculleus sp. MH98A]